MTVALSLPGTDGALDTEQLVEYIEWLRRGEVELDALRVPLEMSPELGRVVDFRAGCGKREGAHLAIAVRLSA
jgi:hypothetical protein